MENQQNLTNSNRCWEKPDKQFIKIGQGRQKDTNVNKLIENRQKSRTSNEIQNTAKTR